MASVEFRFYEELNDYLPADRRKRTFVHTFDKASSIRELIRDQGVPFAEVDLVLVNGESVTPDSLVSDGDRVSVYPVFEAFDIGSVARLRPHPLRRVRFLVASGLERLGRDLRVLGFDTWLPDQGHLQAASSQEGRILLTAQPSQLEPTGVTHALLVRANDSADQLREVVQRLDLHGCLPPHGNCPACNHPLEPWPEEENHDRVQPCPDCGHPGTRAARQLLMADLGQCSVTADSDRSPESEGDGEKTKDKLGGEHSG